MGLCERPIGNSGSLSDGRKGRRYTYCLNPEGKERGSSLSLSLGFRWMCEYLQRSCSKMERSCVTRRAGLFNKQGDRENN